MRREVGGERSRGVETRVEDVVEGIILVDLGFRSVAIDNGGRTIVSELGEQSDAECPLPGLPPQLEKPLRALSPADLNGATLRIGAEDCHFTCQVFVMQPQNDVLASPLLALYLKRDRPVSQAVQRAGRLYRLTEREQETLLGIASGLTSRQIAERMQISPNTVNAFLRLIMGKMRVTTRAGIVGKLVNGKSAEAEETVTGAPSARNLQRVSANGEPA